MKDRSTFGTSLAELLRAKGISVKRLAEMTGYKSKTSIVRTRAANAFLTRSTRWGC